MDLTVPFSSNRRVVTGVCVVFGCSVASGVPWYPMNDTGAAAPCPMTLNSVPLGSDTARR